MRKYPTGRQKRKRNEKQTEQTENSKITDISIPYQ